MWLVERLHLVASVFTIDLCAYAVMHNHYHIVVKLGCSQNLTDEEVITRWMGLYQGPLLMQKYRNGDTLSAAQLTTVKSIIQVWRGRLESLSWFMKCLNEPIARQANAEDQCTGHFWESRFKSQALASEQALLACMAYVDLNPVRACMADSPEDSDYTSLQERLKAPVNRKIHSALAKAHGSLFEVLPIKPLLHFSDQRQKSGTSENGIPFPFREYLHLVDWTGRQIRIGKRGAIGGSLPPILERLAFEEGQWMTKALGFEKVRLRRRCTAP
tara:strand:+ start:58185 stop:59000 length:816 start_codon:yes stop_codon:yes gene_type:complete